MCSNKLEHTSDMRLIFHAEKNQMTFILLELEMQILFNIEYLLLCSIYTVNSVKDSYELFKCLSEESFTCI